MKKCTVSLLIVCLLMALTPIASTASIIAPISTSSPVAPPAEAAASAALVERLNEINAMDKTGMSRAEKRALRKEVRTIKHTLNPGKGGSIGGGIYISAGALILILILLIILL